MRYSIWRAQVSWPARSSTSTVARARVTEIVQRALAPELARSRTRTEVEDENDDLAGPSHFGSARYRGPDHPGPHGRRCDRPNGDRSRASRGGLHPSLVPC